MNDLDAAADGSFSPEVAGLMFLAARYAERLGEVLSTFKVWE